MTTNSSARPSATSKFLAVSYKSGDNTGLALYGDDGDNWSGPWTYAGATTIGKEEWIRQ